MWRNSVTESAYFRENFLGIVETKQRQGERIILIELLSTMPGVSGLNSRYTTDELVLDVFAPVLMVAYGRLYGVEFHILPLLLGEMANLRNKDLIYLDNTATSWPKPAEVVEAMVEYAEDHGGNPGRSGHRMSSIDSSRIVYKTGEGVASLFNAADPIRVNVTGTILPIDRMADAAHKAGAMILVMQRKLPVLSILTWRLWALICWLSQATKGCSDCRELEASPSLNSSRGFCRTSLKAAHLMASALRDCVPESTG